MRVLVCGGRDYGVENDPDYSIPIEQVKTAEQAAEEEANLVFVLDEIHNGEDGPITEIIQGKARGADTLARNWAIDNGVPFTDFEAQWRKYGDSAGFKRNIQMAEQDPDLVLAFPGGRGTKMMVDISKKRGLNVRVIE